MEQLEPLKIEFKSFEQGIENLRIKGGGFQSALVIDMQSAEELNKSIDAWLRECEYFFNESFGTTENMATEDLHAYVKKHNDLKHTINHRVHELQLKKFMAAIVRELHVIMVCVKLSDLVAYPKTDFSSRASLTFEEKEELLLAKLYEYNKHGVDGLIPIRATLEANGAILHTYDEDRKIGKDLESYGYIKTTHYRQLSAQIEAAGIKQYEQFLKQSQSKPEIPLSHKIIQTEVYIENADNNSFVFNNNYSLPSNTDYPELASQLEELKKALLKVIITEENVSPEQLQDATNVTIALQAAQEKNGRKIVNVLKSVGQWGLGAATDIGASLVAEIIKKSAGI